MEARRAEKRGLGAGGRSVEWQEGTVSTLEITAELSRHSMPASWKHEKTGGCLGRVVEITTARGRNITILRKEGRRYYGRMSRGDIYREAEY
jgi:hypothetical protein